MKEEWPVQRERIDHDILVRYQGVDYIALPRRYGKIRQTFVCPVEHSYREHGKRKRHNFGVSPKVNDTCPVCGGVAANYRSL